MAIKIPRILVAGTSGDGGKTLLSLGLISAFKNRGMKVAAFKKGPDYIDAAWLGFAASGKTNFSSATNLDTYLMKDSVVVNAFCQKSCHADIAIIEGNRGLHDGMDENGTHSSASLAKLLKTPVLLVLDATKSTRTLAAIVLGCQKLDSDLNIAGIILNKVAGSRHVDVATKSIEQACAVPVLGAIPKLEGANRIPGRHLGLIPVDEYPHFEDALKYAGSVIEKHVDLDKLEKIFSSVSDLEYVEEKNIINKPASCKIGVLVDGGFSFYYPENLELLKRAGAELVDVHSMSDECLPKLDSLYIGGGFPETHAEDLVENSELRSSIKEFADNGFPIYAECGGLMYLADKIEYKGQSYSMSSVLPITVEMHEKPVGHGYSELLVVGDNEYFSKHTQIKGHEFHYSSIKKKSEKCTSVMEVKRGTGVGNKRDGLTKSNVLAMYTHIHALATPEWATGMMNAAMQQRARQASCS